MESKEVKVYLLRNDIILYIENSKESTKKLLKLIDKFSKFAWYEINILKSLIFHKKTIIVFPCTSNEQFNNEIKKRILFAIV